MKLPLISLLFLLPISVLADGGLPNQPYIYVQGNAEIEKPADMATLRFDLVERNPVMAKANQEVQRKADRALALLDEKKIASGDVIAGEIKSEPQYEENTSRRSKIIGYAVTRPFLVKMRNVTNLSKLIDELIAIGAEFSGIDSGLSNEKELQDQIWKKSLSDARERAEKALHEMEMKIESVFAVSPVSFPRVTTEIWGGDSQAATYTERTFVPPINYRLAPVTIRQNIHVIYLISPAK